MQIEKGFQCGLLHYIFGLFAITGDALRTSYQFAATALDELNQRCQRFGMDNILWLAILILLKHVVTSTLHFLALHILHPVSCLTSVSLRSCI